MRVSKTTKRRAGRRPGARPSAPARGHQELWVLLGLFVLTATSARRDARASSAGADLRWRPR